MHIAHILSRPGTQFSFEFFPPKTPEGSAILFETIEQLTPLQPAFVSVTYGAGGSTRDLTRDLVIRLQRETSLNVVAHLTAVGASRAELHAILEDYARAGIENLMVLRGDPPRDHPDYVPPPDGFRYAADLVAYIKKHFPHFGIGVAGFPEGHPETPNRLLEIEHLKAKVEAGADYICTQLFFDNRDFYDFCERCELAGISVPILAGIMPITSLSGLKRMAELALGARIPAKLLRAVQRAEDDKAIERIGIHWTTEQVFDLYDHNVKGIHFYTLNRSRPTLKVYEILGKSLGENWQIPI
ncbi:MAG: methylenetetrahydrofolate reductase [NAD(P)H] [Anaerolineales bacterium]|nr:methylenetetrahydrofolate reductase [NAD(P)H] [Anaerolineales bacterium]MCX7753669.1 methylenetetrahydrofolate reductase [NAD(P)H] [Anaerolineales bacterium]MDW8279142.1 methylenetetrahydrofolate reductase [NAD(P)H] [Anaerolineales bacterium]